MPLYALTAPTMRRVFIRALSQNEAITILLSDCIQSFVTKTGPLVKAEEVTKVEQLLQIKSLDELPNEFMISISDIEF